jgi:hypothetical protein
LSALPITLGDAFCAPLIYLIVRKVASEKLGVVASLVFIFLPTSLIYEGVSWLSEEPMLFFLLLSVYLLMDDRPFASAFIYSLSILLKQDALFVLPAYLFWMITRYKLSKTVWVVAIVSAVVFMFSLPYLLLDAPDYLGSVSLGLLNGLVGAHAASSVPLEGGASLSGFSIISTNISLPSLTCLNIVDNVFEVSQVCTGVEQNGQILTNWVLTPASSAVRTTLELFAFGLLIPTIPETLAFPQKSRFQFSFAVSIACCLTALFLFSDLAVYKYYYVPLYVFLLLSCTDYVSIGIALTVPFLALFIGIPYLTIIAPLVEMQFLALHAFLRSRQGQRPRSVVDRINAS